MVWNICVDLRAVRHHRRRYLRGHFQSADKGRAPKERRHRPGQRAGGGQQSGARPRASSRRVQEIVAVQQRWAAEVAPWYPMDYDSIDAVDFFLAAVRNHPSQHGAGDGQPLRDRTASAPHGAGPAADSSNQQRIGRRWPQLGNLFMQGQILSPSPADKRKHRQRQQQPRLGLPTRWASGSGVPPNPAAWIMAVSASDPSAAGNRCEATYVAATATFGQRVQQT